ncbi:MAG: hypothetical protein LBV21_01405, partial [Candidatus Adiutrix sp.]|nr:hypothetical protein [Candidatus Adiutrix sp.]
MSQVTDLYNQEQDRLRAETARRRFAGPGGVDIRTALTAAEEVKAQDAAGLSSLAREQGLSEEMALAAPEAVKLEALARKIEASPAFSGWAAQNPINAAYAREDAEGLGRVFQAAAEIEAPDDDKGVLSGLGSFFPKAAGNISKFGWDAAGAAWGGLENALHGAGWLWNKLGGEGEAAGLDLVRGQRRAAQEEARTSGRFLQDEVRNLPERLQGDLLENPEYLLEPTYWAYQGADAAGSMVPALLAAVLPGGQLGVAGRAALGGLVGGSQEGAATFTDLMGEEGADDPRQLLNNTVAAADMALASGLLNSISFGKLFGRAKGPVVQKIRQVAESMATEGFTEWAENPTQALLVGLARNDGAEKIGADVWQAAKDLNVIPGAMLMGGGVSGVNAALSYRERQTFVEQQVKVHQLVEATTTKKLSPEVLASALGAIGPVMTQKVSLSRADLAELKTGAEAAAALGWPAEENGPLTFSLAELHARLDAAQFAEVITIAGKGADGDSLVAARGKLERAVKNVVATAATARDLEKVFQAGDHLADQEQANADLRAQLRAPAAQPAPEGGGSAEVSQLDPGNSDDRLAAEPASPATESGNEVPEGPGATPPATPPVAYARADVLETYFQTAAQQMPEYDTEVLRADLLEGLGITPEAWEEAMTGGGDLEIDLTAVPKVAGNALWDGMIDHLTVEPSAVTAELEKTLAEMPPPPMMMERAGADVTPETRADLEKRLMAAGRSQGQAKRETELASRMFSILSRITGVDPNLYIRNALKFGREGAEGAGVRLNQAAVQAADEALARDSEAWSKSVDAFLAGTLPPRRPVIMLQQTPLVLQMLGAKNLPIATTYDRLKKALVEKHNLPPEVVRQVPAAMADPVMVFKSATRDDSLVMMLELTDQDGATVVVPVALERETSEGWTVNLAASIYGRKHTDTGKINNQWFANQIKAGNLLYQNQQKSRAWAAMVGLQLPPTHRTNATGNRILYEADLVKLRGENPTLYQPGYSASPNRYDRPSLEHIGSGEGAQVHGWGLYAVRGEGEDRKDHVEERYRERLIYRGGIDKGPDF